MTDEIRIYCDGACRGNQKTENIGAWAYRLEQFDRVAEAAGFEKNTTNNKMELQAAIQALSALKEPAKQYPIRVFSDSQYVVSGVNDWHQGWEAKGYDGVKNADLWQQLMKLVYQYHRIQFIWVKGHATNLGNQRVDLLCNKAMDNEEGYYDKFTSTSIS